MPGLPVIEMQSLAASGFHLKHDTVRSCLSALTAVVFACVALVASRNSLLWAVEMAVGSHAFYAIAKSPPPKPSTSKSLVHCQLPGRQVLGLLALAAIHIGFVEPMAPPSGFIMEPVAIGFINFMCQLMLSMRKFPVSTKLGCVVILHGMHALHPIYGIGTDELLLVFLGQITGMLCGRAINSDQQHLLTTVETAHVNRRADSRLNHVIKGQCGGASALLSGLMRVLEQDKGSAAAEAREMMEQIQGMLEDAADWCHSREVFVQLESGTYQVRARPAPPLAWEPGLRAPLCAQRGCNPQQGTGGVAGIAISRWVPVPTAVRLGRVGEAVHDCETS
jgi:hypothetical protein